MNIGERIEELRKNKNINQKEFAKMLGKAQSGISAMEKENKQIKIEDIETICKIFEISSDYLIFGKEEIRKNNEEEEQPLLDIYRQLNPDNKAVCKYKAKELLKEQQEEVKTYEKKGIC